MVALLVASWTSGLLLGFWPALWTFLRLLQLSNDVKLNPELVRFPCSVCFKPVCTNQRALQCDTCAYWCHCVCCGVDNRRYVTYQNTEVFHGCARSVFLTSYPFMIVQFFPVEHLILV